MHRWVFQYVGNKTFDFSSKKKDFLPKNDQIWPKTGIFGQFGPGHAGLFSALLVGRLVVLARGLYLARHLFTLLWKYLFGKDLGVECCQERRQDGWMNPSRDFDNWIWSRFWRWIRCYLKQFNIGERALPLEPLQRFKQSAAAPLNALHTPVKQPAQCLNVSSSCSCVKAQNPLPVWTVLRLDMHKCTIHI